MQLIYNFDLVSSQGFVIWGLLLEEGHSLYVPPKKRTGATQFSPDAVQRTRQIANMRIHVGMWLFRVLDLIFNTTYCADSRSLFLGAERAIRQIKSFKILAKPVIAERKDVISDIFFVCASLCNFVYPPLMNNTKKHTL